MMNQRKYTWRIAHMSDVAKSTRERCIRVAAIVIATMVGTWNSSDPIDSKDVIKVDWTNVRSKVQLNGRSSPVDGREKILPSKFKIADT